MAADEAVVNNGYRKEKKINKNHFNNLFTTLLHIPLWQRMLTTTLLLLPLSFSKSTVTYLLISTVEKSGSAWIRINVLYTGTDTESSWSKFTSLLYPNPDP